MSQRKKRPTLLRLSRTALVATLCLPAGGGCALFGGQTAGASTPEKAPPRPSACELEDGAAPFVFMPPGKYEGTFEYGSAELQLNEDQSFFLRVVTVGDESQWSGTYAWKKERFEALHLCQVKVLRNAKVEPAPGETSSSVMGIDRERHYFTVSVGDFRDISFKPVESS